MDILEEIFKQFYVFPFLFLIAIFWRHFWLFIIGIIAQVFSDLPRINGKWETTMTHTSTSGVVTILTEIATVKQIGRFVYGKIAYTEKNITYKFNFRAELKKHTICGRFKKKGSNKATGSGVFQLIVNGEEKKMQGYTSWYANDTDQIESATYSWKKQ